jgi:crotonobetainyl-CoA:carnitine CoA-transferase CaiB-like acyl-CoA transferase
MGPLHGIRILDLTTVLMGPFATLQLADLGADVIKVESPSGDLVREIGPGKSPGLGGMFLNTNRGKRSLAIDLKAPGAREALLKIAATVDVVVSNVRPRAMARLGLDDAAFRAARADIINVSLVGFGQDGPYAARPAYDDLIQGASGVPSFVAAASGGEPRYVPVNIADRIVGLFAAQAILAALVHRGRTGEGQAVEVPMFESMVGLVLGDHLGGRTYRPALDGGGYARLLSPTRRPYATKDGHICALIYTNGQWQRFFEAIGKPDVAADPRYASTAKRLKVIDAINAEFARIFAERTTAEWQALLEAADIPHTPMHTLETIQDDPHLKAVGFFREVEHPHEGSITSMRLASRWSRSQPEAPEPAPLLGEQSREILEEAGIGEEEIEALFASGAVRHAAQPTRPAPKQGVV